MSGAFSGRAISFPVEYSRALTIPKDVGGVHARQFAARSHVDPEVEESPRFPNRSLEEQIVFSFSKNHGVTAKKRGRERNSDIASGSKKGGWDPDTNSAARGDVALCGVAIHDCSLRRSFCRQKKGNDASLRSWCVDAARSNGLRYIVGPIGVMLDGVMRRGAFAQRRFPRRLVLAASSLSCHLVLLLVLAASSSLSLHS